MVDVVLVDQNDTKIWLCEKYKAHEEWLLHRAFSVYVFDDQGRVLLQQRALTKYHSPGLYANTCCSHQFDWEESIDAAHRRMMEEMGFDCELEKIAELVYQTPVPPWLIEHEYLHVFFGRYAWEEIKPVPQEVASYRWIDYQKLWEMSKNKDATLWPWTAEVVVKLSDYFSTYL